MQWCVHFPIDASGHHATSMDVKSGDTQDLNTIPESLKG